MTTITEEPRARAYAPAMRDSVGTSRRTPRWNLETERRIDDGETIPRGMGWFSIALGLAEVTAGRRLARAIGMEDRATLIQLYGLREIAQGVGVLRSGSTGATEGWMLARIAGDVLDLAMLAPGLSSRNRDRHRVQAAVLAVAGATVLDVLSAYQLEAQRRRPIRGAAQANGSAVGEEVSR